MNDPTQPYSPQQPPTSPVLQPRWLGMPRWLVLVLASLLIVICACGGLFLLVLGNGAKSVATQVQATLTAQSQSVPLLSTDTPGPVVTDTPTQPTATPRPTATDKPQGWATVQHFTGSQNQQTPTFHVPDGARIVWTETLTNTAYNEFAVQMYNSDGTVNDLIVNNANDAASQSSTYNVHGDLDVYLNITADQVNYDIAVQVYQ